MSTPTTATPTASTAGKKGHGIRLTDTQRLEILTAVESATSTDDFGGSRPKLSTKRLAEVYGVTQAAILKLIKQRHKFVARYASGREDVRGNRRRGGDDAKVAFENELYAWICSQKAASQTPGDTTISPSVVQQQALVIAKNYTNLDKFQASWGWYYRFCNRYNVLSPSLDTSPSRSAQDIIPALEKPPSPHVHMYLQLPFQLQSSRQDDDEAAVMLEAATAGNVSVIQTCLFGGVPIDRIDSAGCTALVRATKAAHVHAVKFLLDHGAKPDATDERGVAAVVVAVHRGSYTVAKLLLEALARPDATDSNLKTALHVAAERGELRAVKMLVKFGATVDATDEDDATPLYGAIIRGHVDVASFLLAKGADPSCRHIDGQSCVDVAMRSGVPAMVQCVVRPLPTDTTPRT